jgi:c(7)-type cytochrome triheme protein
MRLRTTILILAGLSCAASGASALDLKEITFDTPGAGKVVFSHKVHLKKKTEKSANVSCKACHPTPSQPDRHYTMADMEDGKSCGKCHTGQQAFSISKCTGCHKVKEITFKVKETGPVRFSHAKHLERMQCNACHNGLYATGPNKSVSMAEMDKGKSCGACHNGVKAFSIEKCGACHPNPKQVVFRVKETGPTVFSHGKHVARYKCSVCHTKLYALGSNRHVSMAAMEKGKSCGTCHNAKEAFSVSQCGRCHPVKDVKFRVASIGDVRFSHQAHLATYKCNACHTRTFPLRTGNRPVTMSEMYKAKSCGACHDGESAFTVHGNCDTCHVRG